MLIVGSSAHAALFFDDFNSGASDQWGNQRGSWFASGGAYDSALPSNAPVTYSDVPFELTDFTLDVDVNNLQDGGIFLRSSYNGGSESGVLLVTGGNGQAGTGLYWHVVQNGSYSGKLNEVGGLFTSGVSDVHLTVKVTGSLFEAFVNGSSTAATTLSDTTFTSGRAGLYDFSANQTFDNFQIDAVPEPATLAAVGLGLAGLSRRRRSRG